MRKWIRERKKRERERDTHRKKEAFLRDYKRLLRVAIMISYFYNKLYYKNALTSTHTHTHTHAHTHTHTDTHAHKLNHIQITKKEREKGRYTVKYVLVHLIIKFNDSYPQKNS